MKEETKPLNRHYVITFTKFGEDVSPLTDKQPTHVAAVYAPSVLDAHNKLKGQKARMLVTIDRIVSTEEYRSEPQTKY